MGRNTKGGGAGRTMWFQSITKGSPHEYLSQAVKRPTEQAATGISITKKKKNSKEGKENPPRLFCSWFITLYNLE